MRSWNVTDCQNSSVEERPGACNTVKLLYSMWMTGCLMMMVYVLYNICRFALNYKRRDKLTIII